MFGGIHQILELSNSPLANVIRYFIGFFVDGKISGGFLYFKVDIYGLGGKKQNQPTNERFHNRTFFSASYNIPNETDGLDLYGSDNFNVYQSSPRTHF